MALDCPEEVDVFSIPHSRMKELVNNYLDLLTGTNFSNVHHLTTLLENLGSAFQEFRTHEQIENKYIMRKLKDKLNMLSIRSSAVCNCHADNKLSEMLQLLQDGYKCTEKSEMDRENYGLKLRRALEDFTEKFLPHMEEEEKVFQPMLMKYFSFEELKAIKNKVIKKHLEKEKEEIAENEILCDSSDDDEKSQTEQKELSAIERVPDEVMLQIFRYLNPRELIRCSGVSKHWNSLALDGSLWRKIRPVQWASGNWTFLDALDVEKEEEHVVQIQEVMSEIMYDEDADIDESEDSDVDGQSAEVKQIQQESRMLTSMVRNLLPRIGSHVQECHLAYSKGLQNGLLYKILQLCPNIEVLDLTQTFISDIGFKSLGKNGSGRKLRHIDLTGCKKITDVTLHRLSYAIHQTKTDNKSENKIQQFADSNVCCMKGRKFELPNVKDIEAVDKALREACDWLEGNIMASRLYEMIENEKIPPSLLSHDSRYIENHRDLTSAYYYCMNWIKSHYQASVFNFPAVETTRLSNLSNFGNILTTLTESSDRVSSDLPARTTSSHSEDNAGHHGNLERTCVSRSRSEACCDSETSSDTDTTDLRGLEFISLSGCYNVTDNGICSLAGEGGLPRLRFLDLSGCVNITSEGLTTLITACPSLDHTHLFYCDNMIDDPYFETASGCQNLECCSRYCCRSGD